jgi:hypothetical protein
MGKSMPNDEDPAGDKKAIGDLVLRRMQYRIEEIKRRHNGGNLVP